MTEPVLRTVKAVVSVPFVGLKKFWRWAWTPFEGGCNGSPGGCLVGILIVIITLLGICMGLSIVSEQCKIKRKKEQVELDKYVEQWSPVKIVKIVYTPEGENFRSKTEYIVQKGDSYNWSIIVYTNDTQLRPEVGETWSLKPGWTINGNLTFKEKLHE